MNIEVRFRTFIFGRFSFENFHFSISSFLGKLFHQDTEVKKKSQTQKNKKIVAKNISRVRHATNEKKN